MMAMSSCSAYIGYTDLRRHARLPLGRPTDGRTRNSVSLADRLAITEKVLSPKKRETKIVSHFQFGLNDRKVVEWHVL